MTVPEQDAPEKIKKNDDRMSSPPLGLIQSWVLAILQIPRNEVVPPPPATSMTVRQNSLPNSKTPHFSRRSRSGSPPFA